MRYDRIYISIGCAVHLFLPLHKCGNRRRILQTVNILQKFGFLIIQAVSPRTACFVSSLLKRQILMANNLDLQVSAS